MRILKLSLPVLLAGALLGGCDQVSAPAPNTQGDAAFVTKLTQLCKSTPALVVLAPLRTPSAIIKAAQTNQKTLWNLQIAVTSITPMLSNATPLAPAITQGDSLILDASNLYGDVARGVMTKNRHLVRGAAGRAHQRLDEAQAELRQIGITDCP